VKCSRSTLRAAFVHHARGRADVGVGCRSQVFLDEIDQARVALQQAEQLQRGVAGLGRAVVVRVCEGRRRACRRHLIWPDARRGLRAQNPYFALWRARSGQSRPF
jgi:hypothetical protein